MKKEMNIVRIIFMNVVFMFCVAFSAQAATFTVTKTVDTNDGVCNADCSLREAITAANANGITDTITFSIPTSDAGYDAGSGRYTITLNALGALPDLSSMTIQGLGANVLTVRRDAAAATLFRIFSINLGATVQISGLTISGGNVITANGTLGGGGIENRGALTLTTSVVSGNKGSNGISNSNGTLNVINSTISGNTGSGIAGAGTITVSNSTVSGNSGLFGGGILTVQSGPSSLTVTNSTISHNSAQNSGGGIYSQNTIPTILRNTIVANNTATTNIDLFGTFTSQGYNLIGINSGATLTPTNGDQIGTLGAPLDPRLGALQNNGGTTETRALLANSPAIDKGNSGGASGDQRGLTRPFDLDNSIYPNTSDASDIGAFEAQAVPSGGGAPTFIVTKTADTNDGLCDSDCSLREAVTAANANAGTDNITFDIEGEDTHLIGLNAALPVLSQSVEIHNNSGEGITISRETGGNYRIFTINAGQIVSISDLTITGGNETSGGGIYNEGILTLDRVTVSNNSATSFGGGIYNHVGAVLNMTNCTVKDNDAAQSGTGGGLALVGTVNITNSTISGNSASNGGGISVFSSAVVTITSSTVSNNSARQSYGGITAAGNFTLRNTIVADNTAAVINTDIVGAVNSHGYNLIETVSGATINETQNAGTNIIGQDPHLGDLQDNGGATETRALQSNSPALDKGKSFGLTTDQRGLPRPIDRPNQTPANNGDNSDIGAFEMPLNRAPVASVSPNPIETNEDTPLTAAILASDLDGDSMTLTVTDTTDHGTLTLEEEECVFGQNNSYCYQSYTYTPTADFNGTDSFSYKANDGQLDSNVFEVVINVLPIEETLFVTKTDDTNDGVCDNDCSLREAINIAGPGSLIEFASPLFDSPQTINLLTNQGFRDLIIFKNLTINGKGANLLTISKDPTEGFRVFNINGNGVNVRLRGMKITGGTTDFSGGGINANEGVNLTVSDCLITGNRAFFGGGISVTPDSTLTLENSTVSANTAYINGGGIFNEGTMFVTNSTVSGNGKILGEFGEEGTGTGGIGNTGTVMIVNSTITDNQSIQPSSESGIQNDGGSMTIRNSIVAGNRNNSNFADVKGAFVSEGYNLIGNVGAATGFVANDLKGTSSAILNPRLSTLGNFGGATPTHALFSNSTAINHADLSNPLTFDQRGIERTIGGRSDIGAFENNFTFSNNPTGAGGAGTLPNSSTAIAYSVQFSATREDAPDSLTNNLVPFTFEVIAGNLPPGLNLDANTGILSGTPTTAGTYNFTIKVTDAADGSSGAQAYVLNVFGPTSANVSVSGRVLAADGIGVRNARVILTSSNGVSRIVKTSTFGFYQFDNVAVGETYVVSVASKRFSFSPKVVSVSQDITDLDFTADSLSN